MERFVDFKCSTQPNKRKLQGGGYEFFAGHEGARAFTTGCFKTHLTDDLRGLSETEVKV
ncbi:hypothetical protein HK096_008578, partial [Nowakowskiella sp. JEL0078]